MANTRPGNDLRAALYRRGKQHKLGTRGSPGVGRFYPCAAQHGEARSDFGELSRAGPRRGRPGGGTPRKVPAVDSGAASVQIPPSRGAPERRRERFRGLTAKQTRMDRMNRMLEANNLGRETILPILYIPVE